MTAEFRARVARSAAHGSAGAAPPGPPPRQTAASPPADVDGALTPAVEGGVHEGPELRGGAGGPGDRAVEHVEGAAGDRDQAGRDPPLEAGGDSGHDGAD